MLTKALMKARHLAMGHRAKTQARAAAGHCLFGDTARGVLNASQADGTATLYVYEPIGKDWWSGEGCTAKDVVDAIAEAKKYGATALDVRILSEGGSVFDGVGIHEALKRCGLKTTAYNDGLCASAATMVALGCEKVIAAPTSTWMSHRAWSMAAGNVDDMLAMADLLGKMDNTIAETYAAKTGKTVEECLAVMSAGTDGTWMNAQECKDFGFADEIASVESDGAEVEDDDDPDNAAMRLIAQTAARVAAHAANKARIDAASDRLKKTTGASPVSSKPAPAAGAKK